MTDKIISEAAVEAACAAWTPGKDGSRYARSMRRALEAALPHIESARAPAKLVSAFDNSPTQHWAVIVERNGQQIVCIESNCLSGRELSEEDKLTIRRAGEHLLSFAGTGGLET